MITNPEPHDHVIPEDTYSSPIKIESGRIDRKLVMDILEAQRWMFGVNKSRAYKPGGSSVDALWVLSRRAVGIVRS
jgi:hypothetical protein